MSRPVGPLASVGREGINIAGPVSTLAGSTTALVGASSRVYPGRAMNAVPGAENCSKETASAAQRRHRPRHACGSLGLIARLPRPPFDCRIDHDGVAGTL